MMTDTAEPSMNQQIFNLGLSKETISAYLLCCGLSDAGNPITVSVLSQVWNASEDLLHQSLRELVEKRIIKPILSDGRTPLVYQLEDVKKWDVSR